MMKKTSSSRTTSGTTAGSSSSSSSTTVSRLFLLNSLLLLLSSSPSSFVVNASQAEGTGPIEFKIENAMPRGNIVDLQFKSRIILPYGPDLYQKSPPSTYIEGEKFDGYGPGMGAAEQIQYDPLNQYLYVMSDAGYITIVDYENPNEPQLTNLGFETLHHKLGAIQICPEQSKLFVSMNKKDRVDIYNLVSRQDQDDQQLKKTPEFERSIDAGPNAKTVLVSNDCNTIVVANTNSGEDLDQGSVTIIQNVLTSSENETITTIPLDFEEWDDEYLLERGLNMPLTKNALEYWDEYSGDANDLNFTDLRSRYSSAIFLEPENLAWNGPEETELLVNLQENNGLLRINMTDLRPVAVAGYGLKDHSVVPVDINDKDGKCNLRTYPSLFAMRNPDTIQTLKYNDKYYVITANEGGGKEYGDWAEEEKSNSIFKGDEFKFDNIFVPKKIFDPSNIKVGHSALFNYDCENPTDENGTETAELCLAKVELSVGSYSIDYESDPSNPIFYRMVLFGGRGWSIYELPEDPENLLKLVFDSGDAMEKDGCAYYPWSHNAKMDDEDAPVEGGNNTLFTKATLDGDDEKLIEDMIEKNDPEEKGCEDQGDGTPGACPLSETTDGESEKDGPAIENVIVGQACGRLFAAMAAEKNSIAMLFDITDITSPDLVKVFHLSPEAQYKSFGVAYNDGTIGEIDPESATFVSAEDSPSGKAGIFWAGAQSGTVSWWEFDCKEDVDDVQELVANEASTSSATGSTESMISMSTFMTIVSSLPFLSSLLLL